MTSRATCPFSWRASASLNMSSTPLSSRRLVGSDSVGHHQVFETDRNTENLPVDDLVLAVLDPIHHLCLRLMEELGVFAV
jgi:hypothetical protein